MSASLQTATTFAKSIRYDRESRDYRAELDGVLIGYYPSYYAAEMALDDAAYERLIAGDCATAQELDGGADVNWNSADPPAPEPPVILDEAPTPEPPESWCGCGASAVYVVYERRTTHRVCDDCYLRDFERNEESSAAWTVESTTAARARAVTRESIQIESRIAVCPNCQGIHHIQKCPELTSALFAPEPAERPWYDVALGRELCRMKWRNFRAFVALLQSVPTQHLVIYAESYIAFMRDYNAKTDLTTKDVLGVWMRIIADEGDRGPAAPALRLAA